MAELDLTNIAGSAIATPGAGVVALYSETTLKELAQKDDAGAIKQIVFGAKAQAVADQAGFAADTYLTGSAIALGAVSPLKIGSRYRLRFDVTKTAAGVVAPVLIVRFGTAGTVADAARVTFTFNAQTAVVDNGQFDIELLFRVVGAAAVIKGLAALRHNLAVTGLGSVNPAGWQQLTVTSGAFDSSVANSILGVSVNGGAAAAWTITLASSEFLY